MDGADVISSLDALLRDERAAIVRLDAAAVERAAEQKQALLAALSAGPPLDAAAAARLGALRPALQHNLILLAHARDCLRDALAAVHLGARGARGGRHPRARLHVTG
jgi:hypothetical protein